MFSIIYLEQKLVTRDSLKLSIEKQEECKVLFSTGSIIDFCDYMKNKFQICVSSLTVIIILKLWK